MATNDLIVAIELGSSKIAGAVGRKRPDGSLQVVAYASEPASGFVRRGVVYNIDKTAQCLTDLVNRLEPELGNATIEQAYVGVGGYTLHSELNTVARSFEEETRVSDNIVTGMEEENAAKEYPGHNILVMVSQEYKIGNNSLNDPVGVNCTRIEGNYLNILARTSVMDNTGKSFELAKVNIANVYAMMGDTKTAQKCFKKLLKEFPGDRWIENQWIDFMLEEQVDLVKVM